MLHLVFFLPLRRFALIWLRCPGCTRHAPHAYGMLLRVSPIASMRKMPHPQTDSSSFNKIISQVDFRDNRVFI